MRALKRAISLFLAGITVLTMMCADDFIGCGVFGIKASAMVSGDYEYSINSGGAIIEHYIGNAGEEGTVTIPSELDGYPVIAIDGWKLTYSPAKVIIPNSVTSIGYGAFSGCKTLTNITIPNSVTSIGKFAFKGCGLTNITIPKSVDYIGGGAFDFCENLTNIEVSGFNEYYSSVDGVLFNEDKTLLKFPEGKKIKSYSIPNGVKTIAGGAFINCKNLTNITIPDSVTAIYSGSADYYGTFEGCENLTNITISNSVTWIQAQTFRNCEKLTNIIIPDSVTYIDQEAFRGCSGLTNITIPDSIISIDRYAFYCCDSLTNVYYSGSEEQWNKITIKFGNECLTDAVIHYNCSVAVSAPTNVKATAGDKQVKLTWTAVSGAAKYRVQRLNGSTWTTIATVSTNSYTNTGLTNGTKYSYRVLASADGSAWSSASAAASATPAAAVKVSAPTNVKATAGDKQVKLTWTAVSGATKYRVQRLNGSTWTTIATVSTNSYTNTGLTNGTKYSYRVLASADGMTWSSASAAASATPAAAVKVSAPTNFKATAGDKQIKLTWTAVSGATKYRIQRLNGSTWTTIATVSTNSYTNTGLTNGTRYYYRVLASADGTTWSGVSAGVSATPASATASTISAPTNVQATVGNKQVKLTWTAVSGATKYRIQRLNDSTWTTIATVSTNSYTNTGLTNGTRYYYRVLASADGTTWSGVSAIIQAVPSQALISAPTNVSATAGDKQIKLTWYGVSSVARYRVQRLNGSTWTTIAIVSTTSYTDTGLAVGTKYSYRVLASADGSAWSSASAAASATPAAAVKVSAPTNVKATAGDKQVKLTWTAVSGAAKYRVQRLNGSTWTTIATTSSTSYTNTGLTNGTKYSYRVLASADGSTWSAVSAVVSATPIA